MKTKSLMITVLALLAFVLSPTPARGEGSSLPLGKGGGMGSKGKTCPVVRIVPERLPDMTMPRIGHSIFYADGELNVVGGHTTNFVPTQTAEYFSNGEWHQVPTAYTHDNGFAVTLPSGEVIIGGGHAEPLGVGQTFMVERYYPKTHTFEGFGCLDRRRALANAALLGDGRIIIAGNSYADDAIGCYDGRSQVQTVKDVKHGYGCPYVLPTSRDDAIIVGSLDTRSLPPDTVWAERVGGDAFRVPLLEKWRLVYHDIPLNCKDSKIDDAYLLSATNDRGELGIIMVRDTCFSLLPTVCPIPTRTQFGPVCYKSPLIIDQRNRRAYVCGCDSLHTRQYILAIDLGPSPITHHPSPITQHPSPITLYYTDPLEGRATYAVPVLSPEGDLILAGGMAGDNYKPLAAVWRYRFQTSPIPSEEEGSFLPLGKGGGIGSSLLTGIIIAVVILLLACALLIIYRRHKVAHQLPLTTQQTTNELFERVCQVMDEEKLFLQSDLKLQDVAARLGTNSSYVSDCINSEQGQSFTQFVNAYRIRYALELLRQQPNTKLSTVAKQSGFNTEMSFFRNFKAVTGMTPREWLNGNS